jgi:multidrug efflux pump
MLVSGMVIGTLFTLFVVPSIYVLVARAHAVAREREEQPVRLPDLVEAS